MIKLLLEADLPVLRDRRAGVLFTLLFSAGGLYFTAKTWETSQQSQITDRYTKAVEQLGSDKSVEVHVGGLYALARIAQDSPADAGTIEDVVKTFLLEHDYRPPPPPSKSPEEDEKESSFPAIPSRWIPEADASAAVRVLGKIARLRGGSAPMVLPPRCPPCRGSSSWRLTQVTGPASARWPGAPPTGTSPRWRNPRLS